MTLDSRISKLENTVAQKKLMHVILSASQGQTEQEIIAQHCAENGLDTNDFKNEDDYIIVQLVPLERDS